LKLLLIGSVDSIANKSNLTIDEVSYLHLMERREHESVHLPFINFIHLFDYLTTLSRLGLYRVYVRIINEYGTVGGMRIGRENRSIQRKPAPMKLCPPQIPNDLGSNPGRHDGVV
jgi:hypothetical protein